MGDYSSLSKLLEPAAVSSATPARSPPARRCSTWPRATATSRSPARARARAWWPPTSRPGWSSAAGRAREAEGYEIEWVEADAEELPFEDGRFDCVGSVFGAMIAPRPERVAARAVPGGAARRHRGHDRLGAGRLLRRAVRASAARYAPAARGRAARSRSGATRRSCASASRASRPAWSASGARSPGRPSRRRRSGPSSSESRRRTWRRARRCRRSATRQMRARRSI